MSVGSLGSVRRGARRLLIALVMAAGLVLAATGLVFAAPAPPPLATPTAGVSIYDLTGKLSASDIHDLQTHANRLIQAGADPVVYLQPFGADRAVTRTQANQLVTSWHLPPRNIVLFVNLDPTGQQNSVVLLAGDTYHSTGVLDDVHEQNILTAQVLPAFRRGDYHGGLVAGLDAINQRLTSGASAPTTTTGTADPRPLLSFLLVMLAIIWAVVAGVRARRPLAAGYAGAGNGAMPHDNLPPALVGALIHGQVGDSEMRATILEMSSAGALDIEPVDDRSVQLRLRDKSRVTQTWELVIWDALTQAADPQQVISATALPHAASDGGAFADTIDSELRQRGFRNLAATPATPAMVANHARARLALGAGGGLMLFSLLALAIPGLREIWFLLCALGAGAAIWGGGKIARTAFVRTRATDLPPDLTPLGIQACAAWQDYAERVRQQRIAHIDPTRLTLFAPVLDDQTAILPWLITAARMGFVPTWLSQGMQQAQARQVALSPFYVYWLALFQGYVDPALIQPLAADPQQLTREDFAQPVGGIAPAPVTAIPFVYPTGYPIFMPIFIDEPAFVQGGPGDGGGNWGGDSGGGGSDWGSGDAGGGGSDWGGGDAGGGGGDWGGGDAGGGGGDF